MSSICGKLSAGSSTRSIILENTQQKTVSIEKPNLAQKTIQSLLTAFFVLSRQEICGNLIIRIVSFMHPITPTNDSFDLKKIRDLFLRVEKKSPNDFGFFKECPDGIFQLDSRLNDYLLMNCRVGIVDFVEELSAFKEAGKDEEKKHSPFSLAKLDTFSAEDLKNFRKKSVFSSMISWDPLEVKQYKSLKPTGKCRLFPLHIFEEFKANNSVNYLHLEKKGIVYLPPEFSLLCICLKNLNLNDNLLSSLPAGFERLTKLKHLSLRNNAISTLTNVTALRQLMKLTLNNNRLTSLPKEISNLQELRIIDLSNNPIGFLPNEFTKLTKLEEAYLTNNGLTSLPKGFLELYKLNTLILDCNLLTSLPDKFSKLRYIQILSLNKNKLLSLPNSLGNLPELKELSLSDNKLQSLPDHFENLRKLKEFFLQKNQLQSLPEKCTKLESLKFLDLRENPIFSLPFGYDPIKLKILYSSQKGDWNSPSFKKQKTTIS